VRFHFRFDVLRRNPGFPRLHDLTDGFLKGDGDAPVRIVGAHFAEVAVVADVVADAVFLEIGEDLGASGKAFCDLKGFEDGAGVGFAAAEIIDLGWAGGLGKFPHETGDIPGVNVVADLLALVAKDLVFAAFEVAFDQIAEEAVEFDAGVVGSGEAAAAQAAGGHVEVASVFLHHDVGGDFGCAEEGVFALVNGKVLRDAFGESRIGVVPAGFALHQRQGVGTVPIDLVGGYVDEGGFRAVPAGGFEQVEGAGGIGVEVVEGNGGGAVVRGLGGGVDDGVRPHGGDEVQHARAVADVEFVVGVAGDGLGEAILIPAGVALRPKKHGALVVVQAVDAAALPGEEKADLRSDEAGGTGDEDIFHWESGGWRTESEKFRNLTVMEPGDITKRHACSEGVEATREGGPEF